MDDIKHGFSLIVAQQQQKKICGVCTRWYVSRLSSCRGFGFAFIDAKFNRVSERNSTATSAKHTKKSRLHEPTEWMEMGRRRASQNRKWEDKYIFKAKSRYPRNTKQFYSVSACFFHEIFPLYITKIHIHGYNVQNFIKISILFDCSLNIYGISYKIRHTHTHRDSAGIWNWSNCGKHFNHSRKISIQL